MPSPKMNPIFFKRKKNTNKHRKYEAKINGHRFPVIKHSDSCYNLSEKYFKRRKETEYGEEDKESERDSFVCVTPKFRLRKNRS